MARLSMGRVSRIVWRRCNPYLPRSVCELILAIRGRIIAARQASPHTDRTLDMQLLKDVHDRWTTGKTRAGDGMRDYPNTRPHLSMDYLAGLVRWLAQSDYKVMSYRALAAPIRVDDEEVEFEHWIESAVTRNEKAVLPVSYTHLTLPTSDLV